MSTNLFKYEYLADSNVLVGVILSDNIEKDDSKAILDYAIEELKNQPDSPNYIMDVRNVTKVSSYAIGVLMKALGVMKKTKGYMILVMTEALLQEIMLQHPEMFDYYAVFHTIEDAVAFIRK